MISIPLTPEDFCDSRGVHRGLVHIGSRRNQNPHAIQSALASREITPIRSQPPSHLLPQRPHIVSPSRAARPPPRRPRYQVETEDRPFDGIAADVKDGEDAVWITFGSTLEDHLTHGIQNVTAIWVRSAVPGRAGSAVLIEAKDGTMTLLELSLPEEYALPPGESQKAPRALNQGGTEQDVADIQSVSDMRSGPRRV